MPIDAARGAARSARDSGGTGDHDLIGDPAADPYVHGRPRTARPCPHLRPLALLRPPQRRLHRRPLPSVSPRSRLVERFPRSGPRPLARREGERGQARHPHHLVDRLVQSTARGDQGLDSTRQQIQRPIPLTQMRLADLTGDRLGRVPFQGLLERDVEVEAVAVPGVVGGGVRQACRRNGRRTGCLPALRGSRAPGRSGR